jgi:NifU-like protein involved in Fe-S cluster formation
MNKDFSELVEYLDKKFENIDDKFEETAKQKDLDELKQRVDNLVTAIDNLTKSITDYHEEQVAMYEKMNIHEKWIKQIAEKVGLKLEY